MNNKPPPTRLDLVLIGGGHAHVHVLKMLGMPPHRQWLVEHGVQVTLIARDLHTPYSGMLPGFVAGHYTYDEIHLDLVKLCRFSNTRLVFAAAEEITYSTAASIQDDDEDDDNEDPTNPLTRRTAGSGMVYCSDGRPPIRFDALSIDVGITPSTAGIIATTTTASSTSDAIIPVKPIANFCRSYQVLQQTILAKYSSSSGTKQNATTKAANNKHVVAIIGGGAGGIELAMSMKHAFRDYPQVQVIVVTRGNSLLAQHNRSVQRIFQRILQERHIDLYHRAEVIGVEPTADGQRKTLVLSETARSYHRNPIVADSVVWCTQASAASWLSEKTPLATTTEGNFIQVESTYESVSHKGIFACGDCCHMVDHPRPKAGVFAVRAGPPVLENLKRYLSGQPLHNYAPQRDFLGLISTGDKYAVASKGWWFALKGRFLWTIKDYIDRTWMEKYTLLPNLEEMMAEMTFAPQRKRRKLAHTATSTTSLNKGRQVADNFFAADPMRCGGCGAKVGTTTVSRVLSTVHKRQVARARSLDQPPSPPIDHDDAAILALPKWGGGALVQTIDYFRSLLDDPFVFGKIVAVHALSDVHAMGAKAQSALALAVVPFAADEAITESLLVHLLSGISDVIQAEGVQLVGGHTCEGVELACGLSVQGYTDSPNKLLRKRGGKVGDKIVLTKPLGTGALFAADMRAQCRGEYMAEAIESMVQSNYEASKIAMATSGVHACTDCTGFGLMGHLLEMLMANEGAGTTKAESIGAVLNIQNMQFLKGGLEASKNEIFSTLQPQNQRSRRAVINHADAAKTFPIEYPLLFDPQTAGGLIFFVNPKVCDTFVSELKGTFSGTTVIGELVPYPENEGAVSGGVCPIGSGGVSTGQRVRIAL